MITLETKNCNKILALSGKINKHDQHTGKEIIPSGLNKIIHQAKFT